MKKTLLLLTFLAVAGMSGTPAQAANHYVSALAGVSWLQDTDINYTSENVVSGGPIEHSVFDSGFTGVAAIGCDFGQTRLEAEAGYQQNDWGSMTNGKASVYSLMANGFYDIPLGGGAELYGMAGVGVAQVNLEGGYTVDTYFGEDSNDYQTIQSDQNYKSHATTFAYQLGAGVTIPLSKGVVLDARYRYFATADFTFTGPSETYVGNVPYVGSDEDLTIWSDPGLNTNISSHSVLLGLRVDI